MESLLIEIKRKVDSFKCKRTTSMAESDIRMVKLRQEISGCFRSDDGGSLFCRIRSYIFSCNKSWQDIMESLNEEAIENNYKMK